MPPGRTLEGVADASADIGGAVHTADHTDVVARRYAAIRTHNAVEGQASGRLRLPTEVGTEGIIALEAAHRQIVDVNVIARRYLPRGKTDNRL